MTARPPLTPKHVARADRERILRVRILAAAGFTILVVVGLIVYGWMQVNIVQPPQPVAIVNGQEISTEAFRDRVRLAQYRLQSQYLGLQDLLASVGDEDLQLRSTYQAQLNNVAQQLGNPLFVGSSVLEGLIQETLIEQEANRREGLVSEEDIDSAIEESFGFTETPVVPPTPSGTEPTATPYTRELFDRNYQALLTNLGSFGVEERAVRSEMRAQLYRERLRDDFEDEVPRVQEQVWARHILVEEEAQANTLREQLDAGEDWVKLASENSTDESNKDAGGDLGWFSRGRMIEPFEQAAFAGSVGEIVGPVETEFGWHLIEILGHEDRELSEADFLGAVSLALDEWLNGAREQADVTIRDYWIDRVPSAPILPSS
ncbi:MAG: peptidylprolyl isomerase [Chloroflexota bacterium]